MSVLTGSFPHRSLNATRAVVPVPRLAAAAAVQSVLDAIQAGEHGRLLVEHHALLDTGCPVLDATVSADPQPGWLRVRYGGETLCLLLDAAGLTGAVLCHHGVARVFGPPPDTGSSAVLAAGTRASRFWHP